jgi:hypothetical protein
LTKHVLLEQDHPYKLIVIGRRLLKA